METWRWNIAVLLDDKPGTGFWIQILCFSHWTLSRLDVRLPFRLGSVQGCRLTVVYYIHPVSWCQRALELRPPRYTGCCVFEATADFCNGWLVPWSWSLKLFHSEISLKHFENEHYLYGVMSVVPSPWVLDPLKVIKGYHRGTKYLQKGIWLLALFTGMRPSAVLYHQGCKHLVISSAEKCWPWDSTSVLRCVVLAPGGVLQSTQLWASVSRL